MTKHSSSILPKPVFPPKRLVLTVRTLIAGGVFVGAGIPPARAELPVPVNVDALSHVHVDIATQGKATAAINGSTLNIKQVTDKATLDWKTFNIGADKHVRFDQPSTTAIALNRIHDQSPSKIMGSLTANGQVYLVNQNGFVFGKNAQVNSNALVATTLGISDEVFQRGITKIFDINNNAALEGNGGVYLKDEQGQFILDANGEKIKIQIFIEKGASIETQGDGGRVIIAAPSVINEGDIETPDGQAIIAGAQDKVYLQEAGSDSDVRGLLVEVGTGGEVENVGKVLAERGNVSLLGFAVNQKGRVSATTSVRLNGSVRLMAGEGIQNPSITGGKLQTRATVRANDIGDGLGTSATVILSEGSLTSIDLDGDKTAKAIDAQPQLQSSIEISGHKVFLRDQAAVIAKSGKVTVSALDNPANPSLKGNARIFMAEGSKIDVSGVKDVSLAMERNTVEVELRKNELRDSPIQRDGVLFGETVSVDVRKANLEYDPETGELTSASIPIADIKGAMDRIERTIDERSTAGGTIVLKSSGDLITKAGSELDFSGGSVRYRDGVIDTTQLSSGGLLVDIAEADPNRTYDAIVKNSPVTKILEKGYQEGMAGGSLTISAYEALLDGALQGSTVDGPLQRTPERRASGSQLTIDLSNDNVFGKQDVVFSRNRTSSLIAESEPLSRKTSDSQEVAELILQDDLFKAAGVRQAIVKTNGAIRIDEGAHVRLPEQSRLELSGVNVDILGSIAGASGEVVVRPLDLTASGLVPTAITLGGKASIDVSGLWINDWLSAKNAKPLGLASINGGSVSLITEQGDLRLEQGSKINVDGGAVHDLDGTVESGMAGSIELTAISHEGGGKISSLLLDGDLTGWSLSQGGSISLSSNEIVVGQAQDAPIRPGVDATPLILKPGFFQQGGFSDYKLTANYFGLKVADNVQLRPLQRNLQLNSVAYDKPSGGSLRRLSSVITLPEFLRTPTYLALNVAQADSQKRQESLVIGKGAVIKTDMEATVALNSNTSIHVDGTIDAPAGNVLLTISPPNQGDTGFFNSQGIWLGPESRLTAKGVYKAELNPYGLTMGDVLPGGTVQLTANRGYIVTAADSLIDVSGTRHQIDMWQMPDRGSVSAVHSKRIASSGGTISLTAAEGMVADGQLDAKGGPGAPGGALRVELNSGTRDKPEIPIAGGFFPDDFAVTKPRTLEISAEMTGTVSDALFRDKVVDTAQYNGRALLSAQRINAADAADLALTVDAVAGNQFVGSIVFDGDIDLTTAKQITLAAPSLKTLNGQVNLNTPYAVLGSNNSRLDTQTGPNSFTSRLAPDAVTGTGRFTVKADAIDLVGGLSFNGFNQANLLSQGDLRMIGSRIRRDTKDYLGELKLVGDLTMQASQIYPATLTQYTVNVSGADSSVNIQSSGQAAAPVFSAGGQLTVNATTIVQGGTLKAPFGKLSLNAVNTLELTSGSLTSVSGSDLIVPFGQVAGGVNWLYPFDTTGTINQLIETPPEKRLSLKGQDIALNDGATIDLAGGGDLLAYEFIPGPGGSVDVLNPNAKGYTEKYAVIPGLGSASTPYDPSEFEASGLAMGDQVYLSGGKGLSAGWYTLLPARYALLPNAYLITPIPDTKDFSVGQNTTDLTGASVVAGRYGVANTAIVDPRWQAFAVEPGAIAGTRSEFTLYSANQFFTDKAAGEGTALPRRPKDAGSLAIDVNKSLDLGARLQASASANGLGGQVDISANHLAIVGRRSEDLNNSSSNGSDETVTLLADDLNRFNAPSLLLGGVRSKEKNGDRITVQAQTVNISGNTSLTGDELILVAKDQVKLESGAVLESRITTGQPGTDLWIANQGLPANSDGALLRLSSDGQADIIRDKTVTGTTGTLIVEEGVSLQGKGSMVLDSTLNTLFDGDLDMQGGALSLKSSRISLGNAPVNTPGLVLNKTQFDLAELKLISQTDLDFYGDIDVSVRRLIVSAANLNGIDNAGGVVTAINADHVNLFNEGAVSSRTVSGTGELIVNAKQIELGSGDYAIQGFQSVKLNAVESIKGSGQRMDEVTGNSVFTDAGRLRVHGNLQVNAGRFIGDNGATTVIDADGYSVDLTSLQADAGPAKAGLGARWSITGNSINSSAWFDMPSGIIELTAKNGAINLWDTSLIDVSGLQVALGDQLRFADAGRVELTSVSSDVNLADSARIVIGGAVSNGRQASDAGSLRVNSKAGWFAWNGSVTANSSAQAIPGLRQGSLHIDVKSGQPLADLSSKLADAGISEEVSLRQRTGDMILAENDSLRAKTLSLSADQGKVTIAGGIDARAAKGGNVDIFGHAGIELTGTGTILASATEEQSSGGKVRLDTVHRTDSGSGFLDLSAQGGVIDVSGGLDGDGGSVHLRTGINGNHANIGAIRTALIGSDAAKATVEATRVYQGQQTITTALIENWRQDTANFMNTVAPVQNFSGATINLLPGIEVRGSGDLTLNNKWDFIDWRYADADGNQTLPGYLTLRAGHDLKINATLSDAFETAAVPGQNNRLYQDMLQAGQSWNYRLIAGNDVELAHSYMDRNPLTPNSNVLVRTQLMVRTGTGDIGIEAGNAIRFLKDSGNSASAAAVYTMGTTAAYTRNQLLQGLIPGLPAREAGETDSQYLNRMDAAQMNQLLRFGFLDEIRIGDLFQKAEFPDRGGDISLRAGGNIEGVETGQRITDWLVRSGVITNNGRPTLWGINISGDRSNQTGSTPTTKGIRFFNQNIGALAGGNVSVIAGGDIRQLSVMIPTTGKPLGTVSETVNQWLVNEAAINGGGDMVIKAGKDIIGGEYFTGLGKASIVAGGGIETSTSNKGAVFQLGDAQFDVSARKGITINSVYNPTLLRQTNLVGGESRFFTYGSDSEVNFRSTAGNIVLQNDAGTGFEYSVFPGTVTAQALSGDISIDKSMILYPTANGQLELLAKQNIGSSATAGQTVSVNMSDTDVTLLPNPMLPAATLEGSLREGLIRAQERLDAFSPTANVIHAAIPVHKDNPTKPLIIAGGGDIGFATGSQVIFFLPKAAEFIAGRDIKNLSVISQNLSSEDATVIKAGRDIVSATQLNSDGAVLSNIDKFQVGGPGQLQVIAGRDINLGSSVGILTVGNLLNPALGQSGGAVISLVGGLSDKLDISGFIRKYSAVPEYQALLLPLNDLSEAEQKEKLDVILGVFFNEIKDSAGSAAAAPEGSRGQLYQRGKDAIQALFSGDQYAGDISLVFSQVKTLDGGSVNMAAPGGKIDVGLAGQLAGIRKGSDQLGVVVQQQGDLNSFSLTDFNVNESRVFTLGGGDITVWSAKGSIDAGKGAKSAIAAPPPITMIDENGNIVTIFPPIVSGSGIQAIGDGRVTLAAPEGIVDAGEAGISGGQVVIAATAVVGASNISASGGTVGVPSAPSAPAVPSGADGAAASAAKSASDMNAKESEAVEESQKTVVSMLTTDVIGFGDCSERDIREAVPGCGDGD